MDPNNRDKLKDVIEILRRLPPKKLIKNIEGS